MLLPPPPPSLPPCLSPPSFVGVHHSRCKWARKSAELSHSRRRPLFPHSTPHLLSVLACTLFLGVLVCYTSTEQVFKEMASKRKVGYKCRIATVVFLLLASIAGLITVAVIQSNWRSKEYGTEYGIVIDSGSSRSNIYLYEWPGEKENETGVVTEKLNCKVRGVPISDLKIDPKKDAETWEGFKACMNNVSAAIPVKKHKTTPLFLGATAGMRLLLRQTEQRR